MFTNADKRSRNWHCLNLAAQLAIFRTLAEIHILHHLCIKCAAFCHILVNIDLAIHHLAEDLDGYASTPSAKPVPGHISHGTGDDHKYDGVCLCTCLGRILVEGRMGIVVD